LRLRNTLSALIFLFVLPLALMGQNGEAKIKEDIENLASKKMKGRLSGTKTGEKASEYVAERFEEIGLTPAGDNGTYFQKFNLKTNLMHGPKADTSEMRETRNVVGYINNGNTQNSTIVLGAHYDHLGYGYDKSRHTGKEEVHYGADDNASGIAMILHLAKELRNRELKNNFLIVAFSAEEQGLLGSKYFTNHLPNNLKPKNINCMFNFDMVGRLDVDSELVMTGAGTSPKWNYILKQTELENGTIMQDPSGLGRSDHTSFYLKEIPVLNFFTGIHDDYHKPTDTPDKIDYKGMMSISDLALEIISEVDAVIKLSFSATEDEKQRRLWEKPENARSKYKVTLGVIPDYRYAAGGMRIESVIPGRPAFKGGMKDGDVVIKLGDTDVTDLQTYMEALSKFESGQKAKVIYKRAGEKLETEIEF